MTGDVYDYAPPAWIRWSETFWSLHAPTFDRDQRGLEIGSYRGENLLRLSPFIGRMIGLESSTDDAVIAAERCRGRPGVEPRGWGGVALPFDDASFDLVYVDFTRPGFVPKDRGLLLLEAKRVLKADARLLALGLAATDAGRALRDAWTDRLFEIGFAIDEAPPLFEPEDLAAAAVAAGFEPRVETFGEALLTLEA